MKAIRTLLLLTIIALSVGHSAAYYQSRDCNVTRTGANWLFMYTEIMASLTDANGDSSGQPTHLSVQNRSSKPCWFDFKQFAYYLRPGESHIPQGKIVVENAGDTWQQDHGYKVEPKGTALVPLPVAYRKKDDPIRIVQVNFVYWLDGKKQSPTPTPGPDSTPTPSDPTRTPNVPTPGDPTFGTPKTGWLIEHDDPSDSSVFGFLFGMKEWFFFNPDGSLVRARLGESGWYDCSGGSSFTWRKEDDKVFVSRSGGAEWGVQIKGDRLHTVEGPGESVSYKATRLDESPLR